MLFILGQTFDLNAAYPWLLFAVQLTVPLAVYVLLSAAFGDRLSRPARVVLAAGLIAVHWAGSPYLADSYYWLTGALENQFCLSLCLIILAGLIRAGTGRGVVAGIAVLAVIVPGIHELYGMFLGAALALGAVLHYRSGSPSRRAWAVVASAAAIGLAINLAVPGHAVRLGHNVPSHDFERLRSLAGQWAQITMGWAMDFRLLMATLLVVGHPRAMAVCPDWLRTDLGWWSATGVVLALGSVALAALANWWTFPTLLPGRTLSAIYFLFLIGWFLAAYATAAAFEARTAPVMWTALAGCFVLALLGSENFRFARDDLTSNRAIWFRAAVRDRDRAIRAAVAAGERNPRVGPITVVPTSFHFADVVDDPVRAPNGWCNDCYRAYDGLDSIGLRATEPPPLAAVDGPVRR